MFTMSDISSDVVLAKSETRSRTSSLGASPVAIPSTNSGAHAENPRRLRERTENSRTTSETGARRVDHRFATASSTFESILAASPAREFAF
jgi:hypothetical protein